MKSAVAGTGFALLLWSCGAMAQIPGVLGLWALNVKASRLPDAAFPTGLASEIRRYQQRADGYLVILATRVYADGTPEFIQVAAKSDGQDYPQYQSGALADLQVSGTTTPFTYSETIADESGAEIIAKRNGTVVNKGTRRISRDGKTMTLDVAAISPDGKQVPILLVFDRLPLQPRAATSSLTDIEAANESLVRNFVAEAAADLHHYRAFLAEDVVFQYDGRRIEGRNALLDQAAGKLASVKTYAAETRRIAVVGNTVLNDRTDVFTMKDGQQVRLEVTSVFRVANGKIAEWREYPRP